MATTAGRGLCAAVGRVAASLLHESSDWQVAVYFSGSRNHCCCEVALEMRNRAPLGGL